MIMTILYNSFTSTPEFYIFLGIVGSTAAGYLAVKCWSMVKSYVKGCVEDGVDELEKEILREIDMKQGEIWRHFDEIQRDHKNRS